MNTKNIVLATATLVALALTACDRSEICSYDENANTLTCVEKTYKTVKTGNKVWLAENLARFDSDSSFCYNNSFESCQKYGRLYPYESAKTICPEGWTLPSQADFEAADLKALNVIYAGYRYASNGKFADEGVSASFWTDKEFDDARGTIVRVKEDGVAYEHFSKNIAFSIRCIKE